MGYLSCKTESSISNSIILSNPHDQPQIIKLKQFDFTELETATDGFSDQNLLGQGSHGRVYKGVVRGGHVIAVKRAIRVDTQHSSNEEVENEIEILSKFTSPHLVNLVGFTTQDDQAPNPRLLVVEFMSNGNLYDVLHSNSNSRSLNWAPRIRLSLQIAKAIEGLHCLNPPVIHRDIKSANVLIDHNFNARLSDFGLAIQCGKEDDYHLRSTPPAGTMGYLDPFYVTPDNLSTKIDIFSFGILLLEIISGRKAIDVGYSPSSIVDWAIPLILRGKIVDIFDPRIEPPKDPRVRKQLAVIATKCVRSCRDKRPSMKEIVESLDELSKLVCFRSWKGIGRQFGTIETIEGVVERRRVHRLSVKAKKYPSNSRDLIVKGT